MIFHDQRRFEYKEDATLGSSRREKWFSCGGEATLAVDPHEDGIQYHWETYVFISASLWNM